MTLPHSISQTYRVRWARTLPCCSLLACLLLVVGGCGDLDLPGRPRPGDRPVPENQVLDFDDLYQRNCAGCHGADGNLGPAPPLNDRVFLAIVTDDVLLQVISNGRRGTPMPGFATAMGGALTEAQIQVLAAGIKSHWQSKAEPPQDAPAYLAADKGDAASLVERGKAVFERACADCHGAGGKGSDEDESPGRINDPAFLSLVSDQALRRYIITGRADLGMPDFAGTDGRAADFKPLTADEIAELVALLASWRSASEPPASAARTTHRN